MPITVWLATAIRVLAVYLILEAVVSVFSMLTTGRSLGMDPQVAFISSGILLLLALFLWQFPMSLANFIVPTTMTPKNMTSIGHDDLLSTTPNPSGRDLAKIGTALLAVYFIVNNLWAVTSVFYLNDLDYRYDGEAMASLTAGLLAIVCGIALLLNTQRISTFICR